MPNQSLNLSAFQQQVLTDLDIDAWYLTPLASPSEDIQQGAISEIVEALSASLQADVAEDTAIKSAATATIAASTATHLSPQGSLSSPSLTVGTNNPNSTQAAVHSGESSPTAATTDNCLPAPIKLAAKQPHVPPHKQVHFPEVQTLSDISWQSIDKAISQANISALGSPTAEWLLIMPPALQQETHDGEWLNPASQQLISEWLAALGKSMTDVYITPLIKQTIKIPRDPDPEWLHEHLVILLTELCLLKPKQVFLMGRLPCQQLLDTSAPLSALMKMSYQLRYTNGTETYSIPLSCLPSPDYFLHMPSEKAWLWQTSKSLIQH